MKGAISNRTFGTCTRLDERACAGEAKAIVKKKLQTVFSERADRIVCDVADGARCAEVLTAFADMAKREIETDETIVVRDTRGLDAARRALPQFQGYLREDRRFVAAAFRKVVGAPRVEALVHESDPACIGLKSLSDEGSVTICDGNHIAYCGVPQD